MPIFWSVNFLFFWRCKCCVSNFPYICSFVIVAKFVNRNLLQTEYSCELFIWDDELDEFLKKSGKYYEPGCSSVLKSEAGYNNCAMTMEFLTQFGKDFGKEFGKEHGTQISAKKHEKLKMKLKAEKKKNFGLIVVLAVSWIVFSVIFKLM
jgi:hypothetical protein